MNHDAFAIGMAVNSGGVVFAWLFLLYDKEAKWWRYLLFNLAITFSFMVGFTIAKGHAS